MFLSVTVIFQVLLSARAPVLVLILPLCDAWARQHFVPGPITSDDVIRRSSSVPLSTTEMPGMGFSLIASMRQLESSPCRRGNCKQQLQSPTTFFGWRSFVLLLKWVLINAM